MSNLVPAADVPAHRVNTFQSIIDERSIAIENGKPAETGTFRSAYWYKSFQMKMGWNPAPGVTTAWELILRGEALPGPNGTPGPSKPYLGVRSPHRTGPFSKWLSYREAREQATAIGSAIRVACGLKGQTPGVAWDGNPSSIEEVTADKVALYMPNCVEWRIADMATVAFNYCSVPLFPNTDMVGIAHMFTLCKLKLVFCLLDQLPKIESIKSPFLEYIVVVPARDGSAVLTDAAKSAFLAKNPAVKGMWNWDAFLVFGRANLQPVTPATNPDEILTICFTSGSTGLPKGAMITHKNMMAESAVWIETCPAESGEQMSSSDVFLSYSPFAHQAERCMYSALTCQGVKIGLSSGDPVILFDDARALNPTVFYLVPRIGNRLVQTLKAMFINSPEKQAAFDKSYAAKRKLLIDQGIIPRDPSLDDPLGVMKSMRDYVGGRFRMSASGAAPAPAANLEFHRVVFGIRLYERFGQTETTSAFTTTGFSDVWNPYGSHVGTGTRQSEFKLVARPEMGYNVSRGADGKWTGSRGEVACRGPVVFRGYYLQPDKTAETVDENGWLLTGDVGEILPDGTLKVVDRVKNVFKLSRGEWVAPEKVEVSLIRSRYVMQIYVDGHRDQPSLVAVVVPDPEQMVAFAKSAGIPSTDPKELAKNPKVREEIFQDMLRVSKEDSLAFFEQVAAIHLHTDPFTVENNLLTPTIKNRRPSLKERFKKEIETLYAELDGKSKAKL